MVWFWQKALEDPALMQIKLSISASHRAAILESCGAPIDMVRKPAQDALRLRVGTIKSVQELLQNKAKIYNGSTIFIISHLIVAEVWALSFSSLFMIYSRDNTGHGRQC